MNMLVNKHILFIFKELIFQLLLVFLILYIELIIINKGSYGLMVLTALKYCSLAIFPAIFNTYFLFSKTSFKNRNNYSLIKFVIIVASNLFFFIALLFIAIFICPKDSTNSLDLLTIFPIPTIILPLVYYLKNFRKKELSIPIKPFFLRGIMYFLIFICLSIILFVLWIFSPTKRYISPYNNASIEIINRGILGGKKSFYLIKHNGKTIAEEAQNISYEKYSKNIVEIVWYYDSLTVFYESIYEGNSDTIKKTYLYNKYKIN